MRKLKELLSVLGLILGLLAKAVDLYKKFQ
jgi:hypothetical protein